MAEIRKHTPSAGSSIAQALAQALGASVRPVAPGARPTPGDDTSNEVAGDNVATGTPATQEPPAAVATQVWDPFVGAQPGVRYTVRKKSR